MTTIEEMALKVYPDNKIRLQKVCYGEIQRQAYSRGAKAVLEEIEKALPFSIRYGYANEKIVEVINELKR